MKKLWTKKTARQELFDSICLMSLVGSITINDALEMVLYGAEKFPDGSAKRETLRWWDTASSFSRKRMLAQVRRKVVAEDRLTGRRGIKR